MTDEQQDRAGITGLKPWAAATGTLLAGIADVVWKGLQVVEALPTN